MSAARAGTRTGTVRAAGLGVLAVGAGFTVVEMLIVVAIMAFLTVGIAQVFRVTGDTVKAGRRVSNLNNYAAMVEKQMRADFGALTRDGFMIMRHRTAGGAPPNYADAMIRLAPDDQSPRRRRVDELQFFVTGDFTSKRDPVHPWRQAKATQARIYYGHGHRKDPGSPDYYDPVELDDLNNGTDTPKFGEPGPNQYASGWTLLRHETLLAQPSSIVEVRLPNTLVDPAPVYQGGEPANAVCEDLDSDIQVACQPAASGIFRYLLPFEPWGNHPRFGNNYLVRDEPPVRPYFTCGVIDIATTDLTEIRAIVLDAQQLYPGRTLPFSFDDDLRDPDDQNGSVFRTDANPGAPNASTRWMHAWMRQALPANSDAGERMRYEPQPPNFLGHLGTASGDQFTKEYQRTDQNMLSAFNFVPGCTEFIVEWSFGKAYPANDPQGRAGQLIWHGMERAGGVSSTGQTLYAALPYGDPNAFGADLYYMPYRRLDGSVGYWPPKEVPAMAGLNINVVREYNGPFGSSMIPEYSYFGYVDPTYQRRSMWTDEPVTGSVPPRGNGLFDGPGECYEDKNGNGRQDAADEPTLGNGDIWFNRGVSGEMADPREPETIPWPWPKLVRITFSLADPGDPLREQTFQFILEVPRSPLDVE